MRDRNPIDTQWSLVPITYHMLASANWRLSYIVDTDQSDLFLSQTPHQYAQERVRTIRTLGMLIYMYMYVLAMQNYHSPDKSTARYSSNR